MSRSSRGFPLGAGKGGGGLGFPMELPQGLNPELLAQVLGGQMVGGAPEVAVEEEEQDDGADRSRWQILYPAYLNKKYTTAKGRRVNLAIAVEDPTVNEMKMICDHLALPARVEITKRYPRDWLWSTGRLRVQLFKENGSPFSSEVPSKRKLMEQMCLLIPKLKSRCAQSPQQAAAGGGKKKKKSSSSSNSPSAAPAAAAA
ncbi:hypothetical protein Esti_002317 [Eimeria stiedai]